MSPRKPKKRPADADQDETMKEPDFPIKKEEKSPRVSLLTENTKCEPYDMYEGEKLINYLNDSQFNNEDLDEEGELSDETKDKIQALDIVVDWHVPMIHRIATRLTNTPNQKQRELFEENGIEVKSGYFNQEEDEIIKKNFTQFCEEYNFDGDPTPFMLPQKLAKINLLQRKRFVQFLAKDLPNRMLCSVYNRFVFLYKKQKTGRFTEEEDALIMKYIKNCNEDTDVYLILSKKLNRHRHCIFKRFKYLIGAKLDIERFILENEDFTWNKSSIQKLVNALLEVSQVTDIQELKNVSIPKHIWMEVAAKTGIPAYRMKAFWEKKLSTQFFAEEPIYRSKIRKDLINYFINNKKYKYWEDIRWRDVAKDFKGVQPLFLFVRMRDMVIKHVPKELRADIQACALHLKEFYYGKKKPKTVDQRLVRFRINSKGNIKTIKDEIKTINEEI